MSENTYNLGSCEYIDRTRRYAEGLAASLNARRKEREETIGKVESIFARIFGIIPEDMPEITLWTADYSFKLLRNKPGRAYVEKPSVYGDIGRRNL